MAKSKERLFAGADGDMQDNGQTMHDNGVADLPLFTAKFPWMIEAYFISFQTDITTARSFPRDGVKRSVIRILTSDIKASVIEGKAALDNLDVYVKLAYRDDLAVQLSFHQENWTKASKNSGKMELLLQEVHDHANSAPFKAALLAKGYTQLEIDQLLTISANLNTKRRLQKEAKSGRPISTETRIVVNNIVYLRMKEIHECAQAVFPDDPAKLNQYRLTTPAAAPSTHMAINVKAQGTEVNLQNAVITFSVPPLPSTYTTDIGGNANVLLPNTTTFVTMHIVCPGFEDLDLTNIPVVPGVTTPLNIHLVAIATGVVNGNVKQFGVNYQGAVITVDGVVVNSVTTGPDGNFVLPNVPVGVRTIRATLAPGVEFQLLTVTVQELIPATANFNF